MIKHLPTVDDYLDWDIRSWSKALAYWETQVDWNKVKRALELGANRGGLTLWLAQKGIEVVCSDLLDSKKSAYPLHHTFGVEQLVSYQDIDATKIPYEKHFDLVICKSVIGGIGRNNDFKKQEEAVNQIYNALKPGGFFLFAENLIASPMHRWMRRYFVKWGNSWRYMSLSELETLTGSFSKVDVLSHGFFSAFGRSEKQRSMLSRADDLLMPIVPSNLRYVGYGIAVK